MTSTATEIPVDIIDNAPDLREYLKDFSESGHCYVWDSELTGLTVEDELLGVSLYKPNSPQHKAAFVFVESSYFEGIPYEEYVEIITPIFKVGKWISHNGKFDNWVMMCRHLPYPKMYRDSIIMIHLEDPDKIKNLETRVKLDLGVEKPKFNEIIGKTWNRINWETDVLPSYNKDGSIASPVITKENLGRYAAEDGYYTWELYKHYEGLLESEPGLIKLLDDMEVPLVDVLADMQYTGVNIDLPLLEDLDSKITKEIAKQKTLIYSMTDCEFNINSGKQLAEVLYERLGYPCERYTKKGAPSTDKHAMKNLTAKGYPVAVELSRYSGLTTLQNNFISAIPRLLNDDGRLRGSLNSLGAATGRFSSSNPNLQNQPNDDEFPVRKAFVASEGFALMVGDYSQIEPRLLSHLSQDKKLIDVYRSGGDVYQGVADELGITRKQAKVVVLAIMYGMGPTSLSISLKISKKEANIFLNTFYFKYKGVASWKKGVENLAKQRGYSLTMFGRKRKLPELNFKGNKAAVASGLRKAVNSTIQGSAADLIKVAMINLYRKFNEKYRGTARQLIQVHDEIIAEAPISDRLYEMKDDMQNIMETVVSLRVPIVFETKLCTDWSQLKDDSFESMTVEQLLAHEDTRYKSYEELLDIASLLQILN